MTNKYLLKGFKGENSWWRYLIMLLAVFVATQLGSIPFAIVSTAKALQNGIQVNTENLTNFELLGINSNLGLMLLMFSFVLGLIVLLALIKPIHQRTITETLTSRKSFDFKRFFFAIAIWGGLMIISLIIGYKMNPDNYQFHFDATQFIILILVSVVFVTLQSTFEEVLFRGYLQQGLAVLTKNAIVPILFTSVIFGLMHAMNPEVKEYGLAIMLPQYIILGLIFAIATIMDDGLEIAIGVHVANNVLTSLLVTHKSSVLQTSALFSVNEIDPVYSLYELIIVSGIFIAIIAHKYKWGSFKKLFDKVKPETISIEN